jgi:hypothetical protein
MGRAAASEPLGDALLRAANGAIEGYAENVPHGVAPDAIQKLYRGQQSLAGGATLKDRVQCRRQRGGRQRGSHYLRFAGTRGMRSGCQTYQAFNLRQIWRPR